MRCVYFNWGSNRQGRLQLVIHHLVVDGVSWRILLEDLQVAYNQQVAGSAVVLSPKTTSWQAWSKGLAAFSAEDSLMAQLPFWQNIHREETKPLPLDVDGANRWEAVTDHAFELDPDTTAALVARFPKSLRAGIDEILLAALSLTLGEWLGGGKVAVEMEGHGCEDLIAGMDLSRTVGWFTALFPLVLDVSGSSFNQALREVEASPSWGSRKRGGLRHPPLPQWPMG